eukprot:jgi/Tetstr1/438857/TSEL_027366.t1
MVFRRMAPASRRLLSAGALLLCLGAAAAMYDATDAVEELTDDNFEEEVLDSEDFWMVEFYAPWCGHCQKLAPEWKKAAKELEGTARLGAVDCDEDGNKALCSKYDVKGFPTIKAFGEDKAKPADYQAAREAAAIVAFAKEGAGPGAASSKLVAALTYLDTYWFLHEDRTPKVLLLTSGADKGRAPSWLASLAAKYKDGRTKSVKFGHADAAAHPQIAKRLGVEAFPALVVARISGTYKEGAGAFAVVSAGLDGKDSAALKAAKAAVDSLALGEEGEKGMAELPAFPPPETPKKLAPTSFHRLDSENADTHCFGGSKPICVLAFADGEEFAGKEDLVALSRKYRNDPFSFAWVDVRKQAEFAAGFGLDPAAAPGSLAIIKHGKRTRFAMHDGAVEAAAVSKLLDRVLGGDVAFKPLKPVPELVPDYLQDDDEVADA